MPPESANEEWFRKNGWGGEEIEFAPDLPVAPVTGVTGVTGVTARLPDGAAGNARNAGNAWDGAVGPLLDEVAVYVRRKVVVTGEQADVVALFVAHTHVRTEIGDEQLELAFRRTPILHVTSAEKESGKTRLLEVLQCLVADPWFTERVSPAALVRKIEKDKPTLLLDESDVAFKSGKEYAEALRGILNAGYRRGGVASLCVPPSWNVQDFSVFCAKVVAGIGRLPDTAASRSIPIELRRRAPGETVEDFFEEEAEAETAKMREQLASFGYQQASTLAASRPEFPVGLRDRTVEIARPLLAIADHAGGDWPGRARRALTALLAREAREDDSLGVRLLADIRRVLDEQRANRIKTAELLWALAGVEESPWGDWFGKTMSAQALSKLLKPFGIKTMPVRVEGETVRGYKREQFEDAWARYLPPPAVTDVTRVTDGAVSEAASNASNACNASPGALSEEDVEREFERFHPGANAKRPTAEQKRQIVLECLEAEAQQRGAT